MVSPRPTDHWIIPVQSRSEYKVSLTHPPPWMGPDGTCWMRERPARPPKEGFPSFVWDGATTLHRQGPLVSIKQRPPSLFIKKEEKGGG